MILGLCVIIAILLIFLEISSRPKRIKNITVIPSRWPFIGNFFQLNENPCLKYLEWSGNVGDEIFQIRMGNKNVVVANSFDSIRELWIKNCVANNSRPQLYTFHQVLSRSSIYTVGTTPFNSSYKRKRKCISTHLHKKVVDSYSDLISDELSLSVFRIFSQLTKGDLSLLKWVQYYSLKISLKLTFNYQIDIDHFEKNLADEIIYVENAIVQMRSHTSNIQDYLPWFRFLSSNKRANELRSRRNKYMDMLFEHGLGQDDGLVSDIIQEMELNELKSICLTMVSAGLDNIGLNFEHCIAQLASSPILQATAYREILNTYGTSFNAWTKCQNDFKCDYIVALLRETLRYFTVLPLSLPRATTKDIHYRDAIIPKGSILFMNAYAGNHDENYFPNSHVFKPERYLNSNFQLLANYNSNHGRIIEDIPSFSFGVGSRMCAGNHLAFKELYILLVKFLVLFEVSSPIKIELDPIKLNKDPSSIAIEPDEFKIHIQVRDDFDVIKAHEMLLLYDNKYILREDDIFV